MGAIETKIGKPLGSSNGQGVADAFKDEVRAERDRLIAEHQKGVQRRQALAAEINQLNANINGVEGGIITLNKILNEGIVPPPPADMPAEDAAAAPVESEPVSA